MNLHNIKGLELDLLLDYMRMRYPSPWFWRIEGNTVAYNTNDIGEPDRWSPLSERDTPMYLREAHEWTNRGRPPR